MPTSALNAMLRQRCPRCRTGRIFRKSILIGFAQMNSSCPVCGLRFEREPGYFLGAMYISYGLGVLTIAALSFLVWLVARWSVMRATVAGVVLFLPLIPALTLFSRTLWIYLDQAFDPDLSPGP